MGQVRWAIWTVTIAATLVVTGGQRARADIASDKPAAIVLYPKIAFDSEAGVDTVVRLTNTDSNIADGRTAAHCFYVDANSHCVGGSAHGDICTDSPSTCSGGGVCTPGWLETDFRIYLTRDQPIEWAASSGLGGARRCDGGDNDRQLCRFDEDCDGGTCGPGLPLANGVCERNPFRSCGQDSDCSPFPGGRCTQSNVGTRIPPVPEDPFVGELKCIVIDPNTGDPIADNELKGEALLTTSTETNYDVASYNALGIQATGVSSGPTKELVLGNGPDAEYNGCPEYLLVDHFFEGVADPVPGSNSTIETSLVLVPCSEDLLRQVPGRAVVQYLVFNEFEQRFSASKAVSCYQETRLCNVDTPNCARSIFSAGVAGTVAGQTRLNAIPAGTEKPYRTIPSAILGIGIQRHRVGVDSVTRSAAFNLQMRTDREENDIITIP